MFPQNAMMILHAALGNALPEIIRAAYADFFDAGQWVSDEIISQKHACPEGAIILPAGVQPSLETVEGLRKSMRGANTLVAFGSGTINDIVKVLALRENMGFVSIPTAPSMNGYGARNASLIVNGQKTSVEGALPRRIVMDEAILCAAPFKMIQAGFGDALSRLSAAADWYFAHTQIGEAYDARIYALIEELEPRVFASAKALLAREARVVLDLTLLLILEGLGMTLYASSRPYSGGEHALAHALEALNPQAVQGLLHGEIVAATTVWMQRLQPENKSQQLVADSGISLDCLAHIDETVVEYAKSLRNRPGYLSLS